jgi:hypothetical protein
MASTPRHLPLAGIQQRTGVIAAHSGLNHSWHDCVLRAASAELEALFPSGADATAVRHFPDIVRSRQPRLIRQRQVHASRLNQVEVFSGG